VRVEPGRLPADDVDHLAFLHCVHKSTYNGSTQDMWCFN
jgi:hypothetical protein